MVFFFLHYEVCVNSIHRVHSPQNKEELFNLHHAQARSVIEHIFGVLKKCFHILLIGPEYDIIIQAQIPVALCAIHNFICIHNPQEELTDEESHNQGGHTGNTFVQHLSNVEGNNANGPVSHWQNQIAQLMWNSYQAILQECKGSNNLNEFLYNTGE